MVKVDLTKKPYFLEKEDIQWVCLLYTSDAADD